MKGTVVEFDEVLGLGTVRSDAGRTYPFHCTQIADGSRRIEMGALVDFDIIPAHLGRWEASAITRAG
jgi:cold shock CspA family protein